MIPAAMILVLIGWSVSSYEATRAWFFPFLNGNLKKNFGSYMDPQLGFSAVVHIFSQVFNVTAFGNVLIAVFVIGLIFRSLTPDQKI